MLVIVASRRDPEARTLVARWAEHRAVLLTCEELSLPGWRHHLDGRAEDVAVLGGRPRPVGEIRGVLVRWPAIFDAELLQIVEEDRQYVAAEMTAFLRSWLRSLPCPVVNRPSACSLVGPAWRPEQWVRIAARLRIPVHPVRRRVRPPAEPSSDQETILSQRVTVVGERWFGEVDPILGARAVRLARAAGVELLTAHFTRRGPAGRLITADLMPELADGAVADAVAELLLGGRRRASRGVAA